MLLEATIIPLTTLPTAHPSPEAVRPLPASVRWSGATTQRSVHSSPPRVDHSRVAAAMVR
jgi:hypothetical protein